MPEILAPAGSTHHRLRRQNHFEPLPQRRLSLAILRSRAKPQATTVGRDPRTRRTRRPAIAWIFRPKRDIRRHGAPCAAATPASPGSEHWAVPTAPAWRRNASHRRCRDRSGALPRWERRHPPVNFARRSCGLVRYGAAKASGNAAAVDSRGPGLLRIAGTRGLRFHAPRGTLPVHWCYWRRFPAARPSGSAPGNLPRNLHA